VEHYLLLYRAAERAALLVYPAIQASVHMNSWKAPLGDPVDPGRRHQVRRKRGNRVDKQHAGLQGPELQLDIDLGQVRLEDLGILRRSAPAPLNTISSWRLVAPSAASMDFARSRSKFQTVFSEASDGVRDRAGM
jgi:hypothetical protein